MADDGKRFLELDALRGIAATWVLLFHYFYEYGRLYRPGGAPLLHVAFPDGVFGVYLFFMISGNVIFMTLRHSARALDFVVSRFSRLYPAYWASIALTASVALLAPLPHQAISARTVAVDATMIQEFFYVGSVDGVYWTLTIELSFYAVMLALFTAGWLRRIESCAWCWLGLVLAARGMSMIGFDLPFRLTLLFVLQYAQWFVLGIVFYLVRESGYTLNRSALIGACVIIEAMVADLTTAFVMAGLILLFALCVGRRLRMLARGPLIWLGAISYPLYLTHQMIGYRILTVFLDAGWNEAAAIAATTVLAILLASAITVGIERPAMRGIRGGYRGIAVKIARLQPTLETRRRPVKGE